MTPFVYSRLVAALLIAIALSASPASASSQAQPFPWWKAVRDLGLSPDQSQKIDGIFQSTMPELRQDWEELERLETKLSRMIESGAEEAQVVRQVDRVEAARATVNKIRTLMLFRMRQVLTPDQRGRFQAMRERWETSRRGTGEASRGRQGPAPGSPGTGTPKDK
jgi:Spy/CpxP family protein refolding chaperone